MFFLLLATLSAVILTGLVLFLRTGFPFWQITQETQETPTATFPKKTIVVTSHTKLASLTFADKNLLLSYLDGYRFWEKLNLLVFQVSEKRANELYLSIDLTDLEDPTYRYIVRYQNPDGRVYQAEGLMVDEDKLHLLLYLSPDLLRTEEKEKLDKRLNVMLLRLIYTLTHEEAKNPNDIALKKVISDFLSMEKKFVEIQK